jgi:hypothetical protein
MDDEIVTGDFQGLPEPENVIFIAVILSDEPMNR